MRIHLVAHPGHSHRSRQRSDIYTSHESFSRKISPCAHITLWLKVSKRAHSLHPHAFHDVTCLTVRLLFPCLVFFLSLTLLLPLHCLPVLSPALKLPQCQIRRGLNPVRTRTMRSIAPWRCTTLSHNGQIVQRNKETRIGPCVCCRHELVCLSCISHSC